MSDLVERLRSAAGQYDIPRDMHDEAADEIEKLRGALAYADAKMWRKYVDDEGRHWAHSPEREPVRKALASSKER